MHTRQGVRRQPPFFPAVFFLPLLHVAVLVMIIDLTLDCKVTGGEIDVAGERGAAAFPSESMGPRYGRVSSRSASRFRCRGPDFRSKTEIRAVCSIFFHVSSPAREAIN